MYVLIPTGAWINDDSHTKTAVNLDLLRAKLKQSFAIKESN
jgi:hypothetical protein